MNDKRMIIQKYKYGTITWLKRGNKYFFIKGNHDIYGQADLVLCQNKWRGNVFYFDRIFFENPPSKFEKEEGVYEGNIENYFNRIDFKYRCMACNQLKNDQGAWRYYKRVLSKVCRKCAPHYKKPKGK